MSIGKETFGLTKRDYSEKITKIINNHRTGSRLIGEPLNFVLRSCRLTEQWKKLSSDPDCKVFLRKIAIAGGRSVKMLSLEKGVVRQPIGKAKLIEHLYPAKKIATSASREEIHYNKVKAAMRRAIGPQLKEFREFVSLPCECPLTERTIKKGTRTDVDHVGLSFSEIADNFLIALNLKYTDIILIGPPTAKRFNDDNLWEAWKDYHKLKARYALVIASANRSKGCGEYSTPIELYGSFDAQGDELSLDF